MRNASKRALIYGASAAVLAGLVYGGFVYRARPDFMTLAGSIEVQLQCASALPERDRNGALFTARAEMLARVAEQLVELEEMEPGNPSVREYRAFVAYLEGRYLDAASGYRGLRAMDACAPEQRDLAVINEAKMLRLAGRPADARALLQGEGAALAPRFRDLAHQELAAMTPEQAGASAGASPDGSPAAPQK
jgi:hypothetical protein